MNKALLAVLFSWPLLVYSQEKEPEKTLRSDTVVITGKINIPINAKGQVVATFYIIDYLLAAERTYFSVIDSTGNFHVRFFLRNTQDISWRFDKAQPSRQLLLAPGDSLHIVVDQSGFHFSGANAKASKDIHNMRTPEESTQYYYEREKGLGLEPEEYLKFCKERFDKDAQWVEQYCKERNCSALFLEWYKSNNEVSYFSDLLAFSWKSLNYGLGSTVRLRGERKLKYDSSFWSSMKPSDPAYLLSSRFIFLLNGYSHRYTRESSAPAEAQKLKLSRIAEILNQKVTTESNDADTRKELNLIKEMYRMSEQGEPVDTAMLRVYWKIAERYDTELKTMESRWWIERHAANLTDIADTNIADILLVQFFSNAQEDYNDIDYLYNTVFPKIRNAQYQNIVTAEYTKNKSLQKEVIVDTNGIRFVRVSLNKTGDQLLTQIVKQNPGKHILLDFWATWCSPCRSDFNKMKALKAKLPSDSIAYVYLCCQSTQEDWVKDVKNMDVKGQHWFVSQLQYNDLQKKLKISGFPSYLLIDGNGKIYKGFSLWDEEAFVEKIRGIVRR
ncbi:thioredoxin family protein [Chryseolinea sp. T2]|uniref:TlpA family protein disulfide reductase n=1 Tax=Chryseolinea sp. T2 TaxID=3129255 RepID=UPI003077F0F8